MKKNEKIAIIPARSGSKRIPNKSIKLFFGKPIIYYSIMAIKKTKLFDRVIVSTDSNKIAKIAKSYGAEVPFIRSKKLASDLVPISKVMKDAINRLDNLINFEDVCCIFPASPLIDSESIKKGYKLFKKKNLNYVFAASKFDHSVYRSFKLYNSKSIKMIFPNNISKRSQDLDDLYFDAAQFYWGKKKAWIEEKKVFGRNSTFIKIDSLKAHDLDTPDDLKIVKKLFKLNSN